MSTKANSKQSTLALAGANVAGKGAASSKDEKKQGTKNKAETSEPENPPADKKQKTSPEDSKEVKKDAATPIMAPPPPPPVVNGAGAPPAAPGAPVPMDTTPSATPSPSKRNHEELMGNKEFPLYHSKVLDATEWVAVKQEVGRKKGEMKLCLCKKQTEQEKKMNKRPQLAQLTTPFTKFANPQGNPWGDWKSKNPKVQDEQNKNAPTKAKFKVAIRALAWDMTNVDANGEDPYCAEWLDHVYPTLERRGYEAAVRYNIFPESDIGMFAKQWKADVESGKTTKSREAYIVDGMIEFGKLQPGVFVPLFDDKGDITDDIKKGKPRHGSRCLTTKKPVCHALFDDEDNKNMSPQELALKQQAFLPVVTDKSIRAVLDKIKKETIDGKPAVYEPLKILTAAGKKGNAGKEFPFSKAILASGDVGNITMRLALTKDPNKNTYMIQKRLVRVALLCRGTSTTQDAAAAAAFAEAELIGGDDFDLSEDVSSSNNTSSDNNGTSDMADDGGDDVGAATFGLSTNNGPTGMDTSDSPN